MNLSRRQLYALGETLGDSVTRFDGCRLVLGGGGGGGSSGKYDSLETLYKEQADSARLLREQAEKNLPGAVDSYVAQTDRVLDPGYAESQANMAATESLAGYVVF